jgi:hypothetical protein
MAYGQAEDAGEDAAGGPGRSGAVVGVDRGEQPVDGRDGDLAQPQLPEPGQDVGVSGKPVQALGACGQLAVVDVGQPEARHRAEPAVDGHRRGLGAAAVAKGFAQPPLGLRPGRSVADDVAAAAVEVAEAGAGLHPMPAEHLEADSPEGPTGSGGLPVTTPRVSALDCGRRCRSPVSFRDTARHGERCGRKLGMDGDLWKPGQAGRDRLAGSSGPGSSAVTSSGPTLSTRLRLFSR